MDHRDRKSKCVSPDQLPQLPVDEQAYIVAIHRLANHCLNHGQDAIAYALAFGAEFVSFNHVAPLVNAEYEAIITAYQAEIGNPEKATVPDVIRLVGRIYARAAQLCTAHADCIDGGINPKNETTP